MAIPLSRTVFSPDIRRADFHARAGNLCLNLPACRHRELEYRFERPVKRRDLLDF